MCLHFFETNGHTIHCPTAEHLKYLEYVSEFCKSHGINLLLKGSLSSGEATKFSDIDIVILENRDCIIEKLVSGYGRLIMANCTERPKGILILIYENGICVDLDVRDSITFEELSCSLLLNNQNIKNFIKKELVRNENICVNNNLEKNRWYKLLRLFHRSLIKKLCFKVVEAENILQEIRNEMETYFDIKWHEEYIEDIGLALDYIKKDYKIPEDFYNLICKLINEVTMCEWY